MLAEDGSSPLALATAAGRVSVAATIARTSSLRFIVARLSYPWHCLRTYQIAR
jgi:hypothetical protein